MTRNRCWVLLIISLLSFHRNCFSSPFIIPVPDEEIVGGGNGTVPSAASEKYEKSTVENITTHSTTTEKTLNLFLNASSTEIASTEYYPVEIYSTDETITAYTTVPFIIEEPIIETSTLNIFEEELITPTSIKASSENSNETIITTVLPKVEESTTIPTTTELTLETSIVINNDNFENSIENPIKIPTGDSPKVNTSGIVYRDESSTVIALFPSNEDIVTDDSLVWYTATPITERTSTKHYNETNNIKYTPTPHMDDFSTYNSIAREYSSIQRSDEVISTTPRMWYIVDSSGVRPYIENITYEEHTTPLPITTTENPVKNTYCFYGNGLDPAKYCISGCNCNNDLITKNQFGNCFVTRNCQPTCYYVDGMNSNDIKTRCFNVKTNDMKVQPVCCYNRNYSNQPYSNQYVLPSECYEFQYSFPISTIYFKCR